MENGQVETAAAGEEPDRDRYVDFLRVAAIGCVVFGHWLVTSVEYRGGAFQAADVLRQIWWAPWVTWAFQVMPVFFLVGGFAAGVSWRRGGNDARIGVDASDAGPAGTAGHAGLTGPAGHGRPAGPVRPVRPVRHRGAAGYGGPAGPARPVGHGGPAGPSGPAGLAAGPAAGPAGPAGLAGHGARWLRRRVLRLLIPTSWYVAGALVATTIASRADAPAQTLALAGWAVALHLWFLPVYLLLTLLTPVMYSAHRRWGTAVPAVMALVGVAIDILVITAHVRALGWLNYVLVWGAAYQLGFAWQDGTLARARRRTWLVAAGGAAVFVALEWSGLFPVSLIGMQGEQINNTAPPSVALEAYAAAQLSTLIAIAPKVSGLLRRPRLWRVVKACNREVMTVYLWHMFPVVIAGVLLYPSGVMSQPAVGTAEWWLLRPVWIALLTVLLVPLVLASRRLRRPRPRTAPRAASAQSPAPAPRAAFAPHSASAPRATSAQTPVSAPPPVSAPSSASAPPSATAPRAAFPPRAATAAAIGGYPLLLYAAIALTSFALARFAIAGFAPDGRLPATAATVYATGVLLMAVQAYRVWTVASEDSPEPGTYP